MSRPAASHDLLFSATFFTCNATGSTSGRYSLTLLTSPAFHIIVANRRSLDRSFWMVFGFFFWTYHQSRTSASTWRGFRLAGFSMFMPNACRRRNAVYTTSFVRVCVLSDAIFPLARIWLCCASTALTDFSKSALISTPVIPICKGQVPFLEYAGFAFRT